VSTESRLLLVYGEGEGGGILGARGIGLPDKPFHVVHHSTSDSLVNFVISSPEDRSISFLTYEPERDEVVNSTIPGVGRLEPLKSYSLPSGEPGFYCFNPSVGDELPSLSSFQRLEGGRFIEQTFSLTVPDLLHAAAVGCVDEDQIPDLVWLSRDVSTGKMELATALGDSTYAFPRRAWSMLRPDSVFERSYLYLSDVDADGAVDLLVAMPASARVLLLAPGNGSGAFDSLRVIASDVGCDQRDHLQIADMDGDSLPDLLVNDGSRGGICLLRGTGSGAFAPPFLLTAAGESANFATGDLNGDGMPDVVITDPRRSLLRIFDGRLLLHVQH
jgi:hypothetical protein